MQKAAKREEGGLPGRVRFSVLVRKYETEEMPDKAPGTQRAYRDSLKPIKSYFFEVLGDPMLDQIRASHIKAFLSWRRTHRADGTPATTPLSTRSRSKDRSVLHQLFAFADLLELCEGNPVRRVPKLKGDERQSVLLTNEQCEALLAGCNDPMVHLYLLLLNETGVRCESEALWLRWEDVNLDSGFITIVSGRDDHRTKSGKTRYVPMTVRLKQALKEHFAVHRFAAGSPWVFHHTRTRRHYKAGQRVLSFRRAVRGAVRRANVALQRDGLDPIPTAPWVGWTMHDLRHRRVTVWLADGKSPVHVQHAMGHSTLATTMGYYRHLPEHLRALVEESGASTPAMQTTVGSQ